MKLAAAASALLALTLLSSPPAAADRTSSATRTTPSLRHLQSPPAPAADVPAPPKAQLAKVCPTDSRECPGTFFAVLRNPTQNCEFYPCPAPAADNASTNGAAANGEKGIATSVANEKITSTDSQDGTVDANLLADMDTLGALANMEEDAQEGEGEPDAAVDDVEVLAVEGDGNDLPTELPVLPVAAEENTGVPVDGEGGNPNGLAAFEDAISAAPGSTAHNTASSTPTAANCTPCTNTPTQNMLKRSYDCTTAIQALAVQCFEDDGWTAGTICEYSCYKAVRGYVQNDVSRGGTRCCEVGETPQAEQAEEEVGQKPEVVETTEVDVGGVDPAEVAREEDIDDADGEEQEPPAAGGTAPAESTTGTVETNTVETNEDEDVGMEMTMEEATEEEMVEAGDAPQPPPSEADDTGTAAAADATTAVEVNGGEQEEAEPEVEVEIISEADEVVDAVPATTTTTTTTDKEEAGAADDEEEEEETNGATDEESAEPVAAGEEITDVAPSEPTEESAATGEEAATGEGAATNQDGGTVDEALLLEEGGGEEDDASIVAEEEVESTTPPEEATTVTMEEVISEDEDEDMDEPTEESAIDEPTPPSTIEDESTTESTADEMTPSVAEKNFDETTDPMCGVDAGDALCPFAEDGTAVYCCSKWGFCGQGVEWCGDGCQEGYGLCGGVESESEDGQVADDQGTEVEDGDTDMDMAGDADDESDESTVDEMPSQSTEEGDEDEATGTDEEVIGEVIMPEGPAGDMEDPNDAMEEVVEVVEESPMDETTDIEDTENGMDEAAIATPDDPIAEVEDPIPGDAVTEISREDGGTTTATSMDDVEDEQGSGLRGGSVAAVQTATSSAAGVKAMASIIIAGASAVIFGMI